MFISVKRGSSHIFVTRCSRRTRVKCYMRNSVQKNYSHDVLRKRLARNKQKSSSRVCFPFFPVAANCSPLSRSRVVNLTLASSMNIVPVKIWIPFPFPLLLPPTVYTYQHSLHYPMPSTLVLNSHSHCLLLIYLVRPILNQFYRQPISYYRCFHPATVFVFLHLWGTEGDFHSLDSDKH